MIIKTKYLYNPFYVYITVFSFAILFFSFGWSRLYPIIDYWMTIFFISTFLISIYLGKIFSANYKIPIIKDYKETRFDYIFYLCLLMIIVEFIIVGEIPFISLISGEIYDYRKFGVKTLHVVISTLSAFYTLHLFQLFLLNKKKIKLLKIFVLLLYPLLTMSRGRLLIIAVGFLFIYLILKNTIKIKNITTIIITGFTILYFFGLLGNLRHQDDEYIQALSAPSKFFANSIIPKQFMWGYIYISSPVANLQLNINSNQSDMAFDEFILGSIIPDFISKHIEQEESDIIKVESWLTVGSVYSKAHKSFGWIGMYLMYIYMCIMIFIYTALLPKNTPYALTGYVILLLITFFNLFDNMWIFAGLCFQLIYPFVLVKLDPILAGFSND